MPVQRPAAPETAHDPLKSSMIEQIRGKPQPPEQQPLRPLDEPPPFGEHVKLFGPKGQEAVAFFRPTRRFDPQGRRWVQGGNWHDATTGQRIVFPLVGWLPRDEVAQP